jgi:signal transduction protein with GAF and PtsI domain
MEPVLASSAMQEIGRGAKVFDHEPVRGTLRHLDGPDDVLALMDAGAEGLVALVRDAGATFLAPLFHTLTGIVCTSGTPRSHIGIVSREFQVPCVMAVVFDGHEPATGLEIEVDCAGPDGIIRG